MPDPNDHLDEALEQEAQAREVEDAWEEAGAEVNLEKGDGP